MRALLFFLLWAGLSCFGQDLQNANWYHSVGNSLHFLPDPFNPYGADEYVGGSLEGVASVSDQSGNLLLYCYGPTIFNFNNDPVYNGTGILGDSTSTQGVIIVPKPNSKNYFVVTISWQGLRYNEVDMSSFSGTGEVYATEKNIPLLDHNNVPIDSSYGNKSEKLTSTVHCNGMDYWIITQIKYHIYTYLVTEDGISGTPVSYTPALIDVDYEFGGVSQTGIGCMKISPDSKRIGIIYQDDHAQDSGGLTFGNFNNSTGEVILDGNIINTPNGHWYYGIEFSPRTKYVYVTADDDLYRLEAYGTSLSNATIIGNFTTVNSHSLQLALNGRIYSTTGGELNLSVINTPDNDIDADFEPYSLEIENGWGALRHGLPQWVHWQNGVCLNSVTLSNPELYYLPHTYRYDYYIRTNNNYAVTPEQHITMKAGKYIELLPNTVISEGSFFQAIIEDCEICSTPSSERHAFGSGSEKPAGMPDILITPSPASAYADIISNHELSRITLIATDGKIIFDQQISNKTTSYRIDTSQYPKGMYIVRIITTTNRMISKKLIIN